MPSIRTTYQPVVRTSEGPFSAAALVGVHTAVIGWDVDPAYDRKDLLGFSIRRSTIDPVTKKTVSTTYLAHYKSFETIADSRGVVVDSNKNPLQQFRWSDYTLKPERSYSYEISPVTGSPSDLTWGKPLVLDIRPSQLVEADLGIYVNRGVTSAFSYLERFRGLKPAEVPDGAAYAWLSRGLRESLLDFIDRAGQGDELHIAIYEFHDEEVARRIKEAQTRGAKIVLIYHSPSQSQKTVKESNHIIDITGLRSVAIPRVKTKISHNKFVVLIHNGNPRALWTGSSNFTEAGFYLQTNIGIVVNNSVEAKAFEAFFQVLKQDPACGRKKEGLTAAQDLVEDVIASSLHSGAFGDETSILFSPVRRDHVVDAAIELLKKAKSAVFVSAPFALDKRIIAALGQNDLDVIEYGLVNTTAKKKIAGLNRYYSLFFTPSRLESYMGRAWDARAFGKHKIHAKTMVIDPWSRTPTVLFGSANFSEPSCRENDENSFLVRGNQRLAAILTTEFMRMFDHYKSRSFINQISTHTAGSESYLKEDGSWSDIYFRRHEKSYKFRDRTVFAGKP